VAKEPDALADLVATNPDQAAERRQALKVVEGLLNQLDADKREASPWQRSRG